MKERVQGFIVGVLCFAIFMSVGYAADFSKKIDVIEDDITIVVNGVKQNIPNFVYDGSTYIPVRAVSTALDKTVEWDEKTKTLVIADAKEIAWDDRYMHFAQVHFGDDLKWIKYRVGEPAEVIKNEDGSIVCKCIIPPEYHYSLPDENGDTKYLGISTPEQTVMFYLNGPEQIKRENLTGVYKIDVLNGDSEMLGTTGDADGTYNGLLKVYGKPYSKELMDDNKSEIVWYQLPGNKTRYLYFVIKDGNIMRHGMEIKYD